MVLFDSNGRYGANERTPRFAAGYGLATGVEDGDTLGFPDHKTREARLEPLGLDAAFLDILLVGHLRRTLVEDSAEMTSVVEARVLVGGLLLFLFLCHIRCYLLIYHICRHKFCLKLLAARLDIIRLYGVEGGFILASILAQFDLNELFVYEFTHHNFQSRSLCYFVSRISKI